MTIEASKVSAQRSDEYRRQARRLRALHTDPAVLQRSLRQLADRSDAGHRVLTNRVVAHPVVTRRAFSRPIDFVAGRVSTAATGTAPAAVDSFVRAVQGAMGGGLLTYSNRLAVLGLAAQLGIGRFEANLLIATVQHQQAVGSKSRSPASDQIDSGRAESVRGKGAMRLPVLVAMLSIVVVTEAVAAFAAWQALGH